MLRAGSCKVPAPTPIPQTLHGRSVLFHFVQSFSDGGSADCISSSAAPDVNGSFVAFGASHLAGLSGRCKGNRQIYLRTRVYGPKWLF